MRRALGLLIAMAGCAHAPAPPDDPSVKQRIEQERLAIRRAMETLYAGQNKEALRQLGAAIQAPAFEGLSSEERHTTLHRATGIAVDLAAWARRTPSCEWTVLAPSEWSKVALAYARRTTSMKEADEPDWQDRLAAAYLSDDVVDGLQSLTRIVREFPALAHDVQSPYVSALIYGSLTEPSAAAARLEALEALDGLTPEQRSKIWLPDRLWAQLAIEAAEHGDVERAAKVARRVRGLDLIVLRADRRLEPIVKAHPEHFDVEASVTALQSQRQADVRTLAGLSLAVGQSAKALEEIDRALAGTAGLDRAKLLDLRADALQELGRSDDAVKSLEEARETPEARAQAFAQSVDLAFLLLKLDRPREALALLPTCDLASAFGRLQLLGMRALAADSLGDELEREEALARIELHGDADEAGATWYLAAAGNPDAAARLLIRRLESPWLRPDALAQVQQYAANRETRRTVEWRARWNALVARPEVQAEIDKVGRVERYALHRFP